MFRDQPVVNGSILNSGGVCLDIPDAFECSVEEIKVTDPRMARNYPGSLWRVLLTAPEANHFDIVWTFRREEQHE
jgi:hypothetical protein